MGKHLAVETKQDALAEAAEFASDARQRAELFNFLAALLNARPDENLVFRLRAIQPGEFFDRLAGDGRDGCVAEGLQAIAEWVYATAGRDVEAVNTQLAVDWTRLFRGLRPGYGPTPPYESLYTGDGKGARVIGEVMNAYRRNGAALEESIHNQADYLGLELATWASWPAKRRRPGNQARKCWRRITTRLPPIS